ncbi:MAG: M56 family metallopeptidase [Deltaproteobacteria bacterium]|nr:M56 family metallopeptidase [Deltaproteobacteria bacterium]
MDFHSIVTNIKTAELIFNLSIQIIAVSLIGWIIMKLWRPRSAPARSAGYLAVLISLALLPFITAMFNINRIAWFESTIELHTPYMQQYEETSHDGMQKPEGMSVNDNTQSEISKSTLRENSISFKKGDWIIPAVNVFGGIWVAGFIVFILRLGFKLSFLKGYMHNLNSDDSERLKSLYSAIKHVFKDRPMPEIYLSSSLSSPVTVGIIRPVMILPLEVKNIEDDELKSILLHELAHIFHGDNFTGFCQHVLSSIFWWNPIVYLLNSSYSDSREDICDNYAINELKSPKKYAATLLNLAEKTCLFSNMPAAAGMSLSKQSLENRVVELLKKERDLSTIYKPSLILLSLTILILISYFGLGMRICFVDRDDSGRIEYSKESQKADINYTIDPSPGEGWQERPEVAFNDFLFVLPEKNAMIFVAGIPVTEGSRWMDAEDFFRVWSEGMQDKYHYKDFKIESSGKTTFDSREAYYVTYEFIFNLNSKKEKVYIIRGDSSFYRIRYSSAKINYSENIETFERYVKSFKIGS